VTTDAAEEALRALARDLLEEIVAGRSVELAREEGEDVLGLVSFNVRPFSRQQRTRKGQVITEEVRGHMATRAPGAHPGDLSGGGLPHPGGGLHYVAGEPGHMVGNISQASWTAHEWGKRHDAIQKVFEGIRDTRQQTKPMWPKESRFDDKGNVKKEMAERDPFLGTRLPAGEKSADEHLNEAQRHLNEAKSGTGSHPQEHGEHMGNAYHSLAEAHRVTREHVLPQTDTAAGQKAVRKALDRIQGHMGELDKLAGAQGATTRAMAEQVPGLDSKRAQALEKVKEAVWDTSNDLFGNARKVGQPLKAGQSRTPVHHLWIAHPETQDHVVHAAIALGKALGGDKEALADAYHHLAEAHRLGVEEVLPRAHVQGPEVKAGVRKHLDQIQGHMEALDKLAGTSPEMTRKVVGTSAQQEERASAVRDEARRAAEAAAEAGNPGHPHLNPTGAPLLYEETRARLHDRALEVYDQKQAQGLADEMASKHGLRAGDTVRAVPSGLGSQGAQEGHVTGFYRAASGEPWANVAFHHVLNPDTRQPLEQPKRPGELKAVQPEAPRGASAVYPNVGQHTANAALRPGGVMSGHDIAGRAVPLPQAPQPVQSPEAAQLEAANRKIEGLSKREAQRRAEDLQNHLSAMKAMEAERQGIAAPGEYQPLTDEQFAAHVQQLDDKIVQALSEGKATDQQYSMDGRGQVWTPERAQLHAEIIHDYLDKQVDVPSRREALFLGGLPGAGKSTLLKNHPGIDRKDYAILNPDNFKVMLAERGAVPEVEGLSPMERAALVHEESAYLTDLAASELERRGKNVAWDVTMKSYTVTNARVQHLSRMGYHVRGLFVDVPVERSAQRVASRYRKGLEAYRQGNNALGGRYVPRHVILRGESRPGVSRARTTFDRLKPYFNSWELHDGSEGMAKLVDRGGAGAAGRGIPSVEELRRQVEGYTGSTEQAARAAEGGGAAEGAARAAETGGAQ
jgi:hypothetical protein